MKSIYKKGAALAAAALMTVAFAGCGGGDKSASKGPNDTLTVGITNFADSLEPTDNYFGWQVMRYGVGECLVHFDSKMNAEPWIAESWKVSDDKMSWTFKIKDIKFSNGTPVTGEAVKKSIERTFAKAPRAKAMFELDHITADGQNVTIYTKKPIATLPGILGDPLFIIVDVDSDGKVDFAKQGPIGTGPYMVKSFSKAKCELDANPNYYAAVPFKHLVINTIDDPNTRAMALQKGEIDIAVNVAAGDLALFQDKNKFNISSISSIRAVLARMYVKEGKPLADKRVRQALLRSLDRETYAKVLLKDTFIAGGPMLPPSLDYDFDGLMKAYPDKYNVESAKKLLEEAGWKDSDGDGIREKDGQKLEIRWLTYPSRQELPLLAESAQATLKEIGMDVQINCTSDNNTIRKDPALWDVYASAMVTAPTGDPEYFFTSCTLDESASNNGHYHSDKLEDLEKQMKQEFDADKRSDLAIQMQQTILDDNAYVFCSYLRMSMIMQSNVTGLTAHPCDYYELTADLDIN